MVDIDAAIGYVVAHGDPVERARLSYLRTGNRPPPGVPLRIENGQTVLGGWPAGADGTVPSVDATCFRLAEIDDLGGLRDPAAERALTWLASVQRGDGTWQEDRSLAPEAPPWAMPGDPEATLYLTAVAGFWMTVAEVEAHPRHEEPARYGNHLAAAARFVVGQLRPDGTWPSFLATGWHAAGLLHDQQFFYESARVQIVLGDRLDDMSPAHVANLAAALRRVNLGDDWLLRTARKRLSETQRTDGGWDSDEGPAFDVNTTLTAIRACR
ncbi:prenyltransferase/squalene oxidase repeat-containing protein [Couchioplanes caeruleus]|uniref:Squalene--hopene cyclase n=1 Tax=Couchioplanes caeruleus subsp. caeruleus TaxID=56427 RepID=A0A1K0FPR9_9ACTN|nr:squalene--hopene cyclase [Couchioplanes caeruleus]OJF14837.1 squalene--hopene cyclase [Couchioplanes caeruleus subsp. caeruleus]